MLYAYVNLNAFGAWCIREEKTGVIYDYNTFMSKFLRTVGTMRLEVHESSLNNYLNEGIVDIPIKEGWTVKYVFDNNKYQNSLLATA
jgi:hypothetical protein